MTADQYCRALKRLDMSQGDLAEAIGVTRGTSWNYANGKQPIPKAVELAIKYLLLTAQDKPA